MIKLNDIHDKHLNDNDISSTVGCHGFWDSFEEEMKVAHITHGGVFGVFSKDGMRLRKPRPDNSKTMTGN